MSTQMISCSEIIERLPPASTLILRGISWGEYEELLDAVGEARGLRLSRAAVIGNKIHLDFSSDPPPDIVGEVDLTHESLVKFPIYAVFGVPEVWRYDGQALTIHHLQQGQYVAARASQALPLITSDTLTMAGCGKETSPAISGAWSVTLTEV